MRLFSRLFNLNDPGWGRGSQNNNAEPPKRPNTDGGPPDLDQVWQDFNQKLSRLFGRRPRGNRPNGAPDGGMNGPTARQSTIGLMVIVVVTVFLWLVSGFFIVQEGQVAVVTQFGKLNGTMPAGFQWRLPYPFQAHEIVNISQLRTFEVGFRGNARNRVLPEALMLTDDENIVDVQFVVQYRLRADGAALYLFKSKDPDESTRQAAQAAMREVVGGRKMVFVLYEGRTAVAGEVQKLMQEILDRYESGIQVSSVAIQNVQPPEQVQSAFDDAVKAGQDRERQINEGQAYANQVVPLARGQASRMIEQAEGYRAKVIGDATGDTSRFNSVLTEYLKAPQVLRQRLYLETMQQLYSNANKVLVDLNSNQVIYLPLDKLAQQVARDPSAHASAGTSMGTSAGAAAQLAPLTSRPPQKQTGATNNISRDRADR